MAPLRSTLSCLFSKQPTNATTVATTATPTTTTTPLITVTARNPVPLDSTRPSLAQLPDAIVRRILTFIHDERPRDLHTVALLSSSLYKEARYVQHYDVHIDLDRYNHVLDRIYLIKQLGQLPTIRTLRVSGRGYVEDQQETNNVLACLGELLPAMIGLRHLFWDVRWTQQTRKVRKGTTTIPIPFPILAAIPAELQLHTSVSCFQDLESHVEAREFLSRLMDSPNLRTLSIQIIYIEEAHCVDTMGHLKSVVLSCPNLTRIPMMEVWYPRAGCDDYGPWHGSPYCGLGFHDGEKPAALEELGFDEYPWGIEGAMTSRDYRGKGYEWNYWANNFDWSRLVRLNNVPPLLASGIAPKLANLRELVIGEGLFAELDFLLRVSSPLEVISLLEWRCIGGNLDLITRFGATIKQLTVHSLESVRTATPSGHVLATALELDRLSKSLHQLKHLVLDIARDQNKWPYKALDAIAAFPNLRTAELWFPMGLGLTGTEPSLTVSAARELFRYLRQRNKGIQRVTLHSGSTAYYLRTNYGLPDPEIRPSWHEHNAVSLECEISYNGQGPEETGGGWLRVSCPDIEPEMNAQLHQLSLQADREQLNPRDLDRDGLRLKVALDGPLDSDAWSAWQSGQRGPCPTQPEVKENKLNKSVLRRFKCVWKKEKM